MKLSGAIIQFTVHFRYKYINKSGMLRLLLVALNHLVNIKIKFCQNLQQIAFQKYIVHNVNTD